MNRRRFILTALGAVVGLAACAMPPPCPPMPDPVDTDLDDQEEGPELAQHSLFNIDEANYLKWSASYNGGNQ